jgi:hypothetical protein
MSQGEELPGRGRENAGRGRHPGLACGLYDGRVHRGCGCSPASVETGGLVCLRCRFVFSQNALGGRGFPCCGGWRTGAKEENRGPWGIGCPER